MKPITTIAAIFLLLLSAGCSPSDFTTTHSITPTDRMPQGFASWTDEIPPYELVSGDKVKVMFQLTPELNEEVLVGPDGIISTRAAGAVMASGRTLLQLQGDIAKAATALLNKPIVTVALAEAPKAQVFVGGAVTRSGAYDIGGRRRGPLEAVQLAGGFSPEARMNAVVLIRRNALDRPMLRIIDIRGLVEGSDERADVPLISGDIVFVPQSRVTEVDLWITQFLPFTKGLNYTINQNAPVF